ncbi:cytochrome c [Paracoccus sp. Z118]|uniref:c-type cytochrome n=1 Tax=Paracoccus sp. Z118 TaxID=2851017 RepID=UPI001C2C59AA|nr:cytochrome c [Paracoccus sp. Z118]MBV0891437.1 cytochrome c [Paracoccus sp. Z118]
MADAPLLAAAFAAIAAGLAATALPAAVPAGTGGAAAHVTDRRAAELEHMVVQDCGSCHGLTMKGGLGSPITPEVLEGRDPEGLAAIVLDGVPGTAMPPWRPLISEAEALWIAEYLLKERPE